MKSTGVQCYECSEYGYYTHKCANQKKKKGKTMQVLQDDSNYSYDEGSNAYLFLLFQLVLLIRLVSLFKKHTDIDNKTYESNDNEDIQEAYNELFEVSSTLKNRL